jgi:signal transduction histidine kinase/ActR/RegA family two-component response regulator
MPPRARRLDRWVPALYAAISAVWILVSDVIVARSSRTVEENEAWSLIKGLGFVALTAIALHVGLRWALARHHRAHALLEASEARYRAFFENLRELVLVFEAVRDEHGAAIDWALRDANRAALEHLGMRPDDALAQAATKTFGAAAKALVGDRWATVLATGEPWSGELAIGDRRFLQSVFRLGDDMVACAAVEITDRVRATEALRESNERKSDFIAMLSHELRNPLAAMRHALWLQDHAGESERARRARDTLARQLLHLTRVTDDLVDVTRLSRGKIEIHRERTDLVELAGRVIQDHEALFASREVSLTTELASLPLWIDADPTRLAQVLGNLLWNAARFTQPGGHATVTVERAGGGLAVVRVRDDGVGIPRPLLEHIFDPFFQADTSLDRSKGGLGLGLYLVKALLELHRGSVEAASEGPGRGSVFTIRLPLAAERPTLLTPPRQPSGSMPHRRVLVVEDNVDAADTLREVLLMWDHEVEVAHDGRQGLEKARAFRPDVVLCDIGLPRMDGYEVARAIRADPDLSTTFLVAVTGYASSEDARRAVSAGFDRHLGKPVPIEVVEEVLTTAPAPAAS